MEKLYFYVIISKYLYSYNFYELKASSSLITKIFHKCMCSYEFKIKSIKYDTTEFFLIKNKGMSKI